MSNSPFAFPNEERNQSPPAVTVVAIADLRALLPGQAGAAIVGGTTTIGDGGGGLFVWDGTSTAADNGSSIIASDAVPGTGRWIRTVGTASALAGDTFGPLGSTTTGALRGVAVPTLAPTSRQILMAASPAQLTYSALVPADVPGVNGVTFNGAPTLEQELRATGSTGAVWKDADNVVVNPIGGGADDWPSLLSTMQRWAYKRAIVLAPGTWNCKSVWTDTVSQAPGMPSGTVLIGNPGVTILQSLPAGTGDPFKCAFAANIPTASATSTLSANVVVGSKTLSVTGNIATVGAYILAKESGQSYRWSIFRVRAVSGVGPYTVTVDRPIRIAFKSGDEVDIVTPPQDIRIFGNGMLVTGTGSRYLEFWGGQHCRVEDVHFDCSGGAVSERLASFDVGSYDCQFIRCYGDGASAPIQGLSFETGEHNLADTCEVSRCGLNGFILQDSIDVEVRGSAAYACGPSGGSGAAFIAAAGNTEGCFDCRIIGGNFSGNAQDGIAFTQGATQCKVIGATVSDNGTNGINLNGSGGLVRNKIVGCSIERNAVSGVSVDAGSISLLIQATSLCSNPTGLSVIAGATGTRIVGIDLDGCTGFGVNAAADVWASNVSGVLASSATQGIQQTTGIFRGSRIALECPGTSNYVAYAISGGEIDLIDSTLKTGTGAGSVGAYASGSGSTMRLERVKITQGGAGTTGLLTFSTAVMHLNDVDSSSCTTPTSFDPASTVTEIAPDVTWALASSGAITETIASGVTNFTLKQSDLTTNSGTGANFNIAAQSETGTTSTGGSLNLSSGSGTTTAGNVNVQCGGTTQLTVSPTVAAVKITSPAATTKGLVIQRASSQSVALVDIFDSDGTSHLLSLSSAATILQWGAGVVNPSFTQSTLGGTGAVAGSQLSIVAQAGQAQTGGAANNPGGELLLSGGARGTGGSGAAANHGGVQLQAGGVTGLRVGWDAASNSSKLAFYTASLITIPTVSGTLSGATLAQLTSVVQSLLAAINDKGSGLGLVHDTTT